MPGTSIDLIVGGYRMARQMVHGMCADLTPAEFRHQPVPGANSAAWIVGHLTLSTQRTAARLGATGLPELPEDFVERYRATRQPVAVAQQGLGEKEELLRLLDGCVELLMAAIQRLPAESLDGPVPKPFPPVATNAGEAFLFGTLHVAMHCGQLSTIRRSLGKPPLF